MVTSMVSTRAVKLFAPTGEIREIATAGFEDGEPWEYGPFRSACEVLAAVAELGCGYNEPDPDERPLLASLLPQLAGKIAKGRTLEPGEPLPAVEMKLEVLPGFVLRRRDL